MTALYTLSINFPGLKELNEVGAYCIMLSPATLLIQKCFVKAKLLGNKAELVSTEHAYTWNKIARAKT